MSVLDEVYRYHGAAKPNPVRLAVPAHTPHRISGIGQIVPIPGPTGRADPGLLASVGVELRGEDLYQHGRLIRSCYRWWTGPKDLALGVSIDVSDHGALLHLSASHTKRLPTWETMTALRAWCFPDTVDVAMILPRRADYVNISEFCLHLWQIPVEWGLQ